MKILREIGEKIKGFRLQEIILPIIVILVGLGAFGLGRLSVAEEGREPVRVLYPEGRAALTDSTGSPQANLGQAGQGSVVASKNSTKYHFPWCSGAQRINEENKITFESIEAARAAGYEPAANCKGLE